VRRRIHAALPNKKTTDMDLHMPMTLEEFRKVAARFADYWFDDDPFSKESFEHHVSSSLIDNWDAIPQKELFYYDLAVRETVFEGEMTWAQATDPLGPFYRKMITPGLIRHASLPSALTREQGYGGLNFFSKADLCQPFNSVNGCREMGGRGPNGGGGSGAFGAGASNLICTKGRHACFLHMVENQSLKNCPLCYGYDQEMVSAEKKANGPFQLPPRRRQQQQQPQAPPPRRAGGGGSGGSGGSGRGNRSTYDNQARSDVRGRSRDREEQRRDRSHSPQGRGRPNKAARIRSKDKVEES
jgi:hypothetical protein